VSVDGGYEPVWSHDGKRLFYRHGREIVAATVQAGQRFGVGERRMMFEGSFFAVPLQHPSYDVSPDGKHFVVLRTDDSGQLVVVENWLTELRAPIRKD
jgi:hypothetical protein